MKLVYKIRKRLKRELLPLPQSDKITLELRKLKKKSLSTTYEEQPINQQILAVAKMSYDASRSGTHAQVVATLLLALSKIPAWKLAIQNKNPKIDEILAIRDISQASFLLSLSGIFYKESLKLFEFISTACLRLLSLNNKFGANKEDILYIINNLACAGYVSRNDISYSIIIHQYETLLCELDPMIQRDGLGYSLLSSYALKHLWKHSAKQKKIRIPSASSRPGTRYGQRISSYGGSLLSPLSLSPNNVLITFY